MIVPIAHKEVDLRTNLTRDVVNCHITFQDDSEHYGYMAEREYGCNYGAGRPNRKAKRIGKMARQLYTIFHSPVKKKLNEGPLKVSEMKLMRKRNNRQEMAVFREKGEWCTVAWHSRMTDRSPYTY